MPTPKLTTAQKAARDANMAAAKGRLQANGLLPYQNAEETNLGCGQRSADDYDLQAGQKASLKEAVGGAAVLRQHVAQNRGVPVRSTHEDLLRRALPVDTTGGKPEGFRASAAIAVPVRTMPQVSAQRVQLPPVRPPPSRLEARNEEDIDAQLQLAMSESRYEQALVDLKEVEEDLQHAHAKQCVQHAFDTWRMAVMQAKIDAISKVSFEEGQALQQLNDELEKTKAELDAMQKQCAKQKLMISEQEKTISDQEETISTFCERSSAWTSEHEQTMGQITDKLGEALYAKDMLQHKLHLRDTHINNLEKSAQQRMNFVEAESRRSEATLANTARRYNQGYRALGVQILALASVAASVATSTRLLVDNVSQQQAQTLAVESVNMHVMRDLCDVSMCRNNEHGIHYSSRTPRSYSASQVHMSITASSVDADDVRHEQVQDELIEQLQQKVRTLEESVTQSIATAKIEIGADNDASIEHLAHAVAEENDKNKLELEEMYSELHGMVENALVTSLEAKEEVAQLVAQMTASAVPSDGSTPTHYDSSEFDAEEQAAATLEPAAGAAEVPAADVNAAAGATEEPVAAATQEPAAGAAEAPVNVDSDSQPNDFAVAAGNWALPRGSGMRHW